MAVLARLTGLQRMIRAWRTDQPTELASQLEEHQREVDEALRRVGAAAWPRLAERAVAGGTHTAKLGELLLVETTTRDAEVKLPEVTGDVLGSVCGVAKLRTTNEVRVSVPRGRIDGSTEALTLAAVGMRLFVATTKGWWSVRDRSDYYAVDGARFEAGTDAGSVDARVAREGRIVTLSAEVTADGGVGEEIASASGWLPTWARPAIRTIAWCDLVTSSNNALMTEVGTDGTVKFLKRNLSSGISATNWSTSETRNFQVSYVAAL